MLMIIKEVRKITRCTRVVFFLSHLDVVRPCKGREEIFYMSPRTSLLATDFPCKARRKELHFPTSFNVITSFLRNSKIICQSSDRILFGKKWKLAEHRYSCVKQLYTLNVDKKIHVSHVMCTTLCFNSGR